MHNAAALCKNPLKMLKQKKLVCFDLDGTLIDSVGIWNQVDAQLIFKLSGQSVDLFAVQQQRDIQLKKFKQSADPYLDYCGFIQQNYAIQDLSAEEIKLQRYAVAHHFLDHVIALKPEADIFVKALRQRGLFTAVTTTTSLSNIQRYQQNNTGIHSRLDFQHDFDLILTRENVQNIKPHPEIYLQAMEYFHLQPQDCFIIEDSLIGVEAAKQAGIEVIAIHDVYSEHEKEQIQAQADFYAQDFKMLLQYIG